MLEGRGWDVGGRGVRVKGCVMLEGRVCNVEGNGCVTLEGRGGMLKGRGVAC